MGGALYMRGCSCVMLFVSGDLTLVCFGHIPGLWREADVGMRCQRVAGDHPNIRHGGKAGQGGGGHAFLYLFVFLCATPDRFRGFLCMLLFHAFCI